MMGFFDFLKPASSSPPPAPGPPQPVIPKGGGPDAPRLYDCYFNNQLATMVTSATKAALKDGVNFMEVIYPAVPNLEEIDYGTALNQKFIIDVTGRLQAPDYLVKKTSYSKVAFANVDCANRVAAGAVGGKQRAFLLTADGTVRSDDVKLNQNVRLVRGRMQVPIPPEVTASDLLVVMNPGTEGQFKQAEAVGRQGYTTLAFNAPFSLRYDIGQGKPWEPIFILKRITRGWIFRSYPHPFRVYVEAPSRDLILVKEYLPGQMPSLREVSSISRSESERRYGVLKNDRYMTQRL